MAFKLFHKLNSKINKGSLCLKLDISKAFDKLNWPFLFSALKFFHFSDAWISLIKECVCTSKGSVLLNRMPKGFFSSFCGLREGDPLSPYLFILAEEILSLYLHSLQNQGLFLPLSKVSSTPCHLLYAKDILIFMQGKASSVLILQDLLATYWSAAGQFFNLQKSQLLIGKSGSRRKRKISSILGIQESSTQLKNLGTPICFGSPKRRHFLPLLDVVHSKLSAWKANTLSFAGRLILIKHVISSLPIHLATIIPLLASTCNEIESKTRLFLWSGNAHHRKIHYVSWATVTLPKAEGGLGIRKISEVNTASFIKLGWHASTANSFWSIWFKNRYFKYQPIWSSDNTIYGSCIWRKIRRTTPLIHQGTSWVFGNGQSINACLDSWTACDLVFACFPLQLFPRDQWLSSLFHSRTWFIPDSLPPSVHQHLLPLLSDLSPNPIPRGTLFEQQFVHFLQHPVAFSIAFVSQYIVRIILFAGQH
ncbi:hypothetical protein AAC387_Pa10g2137 [Persea americana]